jgi:hypothetical protein
LLLEEEKLKKNQFQQDAVGFGTWLGRRHAFSLIAGRCSAAEAQCLRELRESKEYRKLGLNWEECCKQQAGIGRSSADQIIRNLEEFGPDYFVIAQVTGISVKEYRRISGSVSNHYLLHAGEEIPIRVENALQLVTAVETLRREAAAAPSGAADDGAEAARAFDKAERALRTATAELQKLSGMELDEDGRVRLQSVIDESTGTLKLIGLHVSI